jgi:SAM-dependent methyltransferase
MDAAAMSRFWDERSREDAFFFVDDTGRYGAPDLERFWAGGEEIIDAITSMLGVEVGRDDEVVDLGCGVGRLTRVLAARGRHVTAIDVSGAMLARARELNPELSDVEWLHGDGVSLRPLGDASVDALVSWVVFQHIPDPEVTLGYVREIGRVLRPGGWAAFQISDDPTVHEHRGGRERVRRALRALTGRGPKGQSAPEWRGSAVGLGRVSDTAAQAALTVERVSGEGTQFCLVLVRR